jgi:Ca2+-binding EF-hand superfamily protein
MKTHLSARTIHLGRIAVGLLAITFTSRTYAQPPAGPPPGGAPMGGMMIMGGGPWGGGSGGDRGGDRGDRGRGSWGGGGFDPSQFISRMDTNGNGALDPEEVQGPARFMLERMARNNPKIDISKPIPISVLTESIQQMRGGSGGPSGAWGGPWAGFGSDDESVEAPKQTLVPGFGLRVERSPVPGFGSSTALSAIQVEERDRRDADERMRRYDKNNDGSLDQEEIKEARWSDSLAQWDRNRDGKLSRDEVAARYARRREQRQDQESRTRSEEEKRGRQQTANDGEKKEPTRPFEKTASFRLKGSEGGPVRPAGLPEWFVRDDADGDNQVAMNEFARKWDASTLEDFAKFDANDDGYITAKECLAGVKKGYLKGSGPSATTASTKPESPEGNNALPSTSSAGSSTRPTPNVTSSGGISAEMIDWSRKNLPKKDKDKNGYLTPDEFSDSSKQFGDVDTDGNGQISVEEYAAYRLNRFKKQP